MPKGAEARARWDPAGRVVEGRGMAAGFNYQAYLKSPAWSARRRQVFLRCGGVCEGCGQRPMEHCHHKTYEHLGDEYLFEIVGLCESCHKKIHNIADEPQGEKS